MEISRSEPMATSKRVTNAAPPLHRFSLDVSSSKLTPRRSRPRTVRGKRTAILRSERCFDTEGLTWAMRWVLPHGGSLLEKAFHALQHFSLRSRRMHVSTKFAAVPHAMREPAGELFHFANTIGQVGSGNFLVVAGK